MRTISPFLGKLRYVAFFLLAFLGSISSYAQLDTIFNGYISPMVMVANNAPSFSFQGAFINQAKTHTASQAPLSSIIIMASGGRCYEFDVDTIYAIGNILYGDITDLSGNLATLPTGMATIIEKTPVKGLIPYPAGVTTILESCIQQKNMLLIDTVSFGSSSVLFDSGRPILRTPSVGVNIGGSTVSDWLNYWYFTAPSLTLTLTPSTTVYEVGTSTAITMTGSVSNPGGATLGLRELKRLSPLATLDTGNPYNGAFTFTPQKDSTGIYNEFTYSFRADQAWSFGSESGTASSPTRTVTAVYPVLYGMSATDLSVTGNPYTTLTKLVEAEGNKTVSLTGSGFIYYAVPKTWGDFTLSQIIDHNGFNVTPSFTSYDIQVSSSGLTNNWVNVDYKLYKLNTTTTTSGFK